MNYKLCIPILLIILLSSIPAYAGLPKTQVSELYVTILGRASERMGNIYWQYQPDMATAAAAILDTPAAKDYFGSSLDTDQAFIEHLYKNTLNKTMANDSTGIIYWVGMLNAGLTRGEVVAELIKAIKTYAPGSSHYDNNNSGSGQLSSEDQATLAAYHRFQNRVTVSNYMADTIFPPPYDWATSTAFSATGLNVTDNAATVTDAKKEIDRLKNRIPPIELARTIINLEAGESKTLMIYGGDGTFSVVNSNTQVASAYISGNLLEITGLSEGTITLVVSDTGDRSADIAVTVNDFTPPVGTCGAYIAPGVWKEFDCYNLAAIGKTTGDDPFTPSWRLIGGYWQWGRKGPDPSQWYDTNTPNFAHGPTGPDLADANNGEIAGWYSSDAPDGAWTDDHKTDNDPCPAGFRLPTKEEWEGVVDYNAQKKVGTWLVNETNYSSALFFGNNLMLPTAGLRGNDSEVLYFRGHAGSYWSSSELYSSNAFLTFSNFVDSISVGMGNTETNRQLGLSVRCVAE